VKASERYFENHLGGSSYQPLSSELDCQNLYNAVTVEMGDPWDEGASKFPVPLIL
jgi:hypothetical protein